MRIRIHKLKSKKNEQETQIKQKKTHSYTNREKREKICKCTLTHKLKKRK